MRYKALPASVRRPSAPLPETRPRQPGGPSRRLRDWIALGVMVALLPALILPSVMTIANGPSMWAEPPQAVAGTSVDVHGSGFTPRARGFLALDSATSGPAFRVGRDGTFTVRLDVPAAAEEGPHAVDAMMQAARSPSARAKAGAALAVAATLTLVVVAADTGLQSPQASGAAQATPTVTAGSSASATPGGSDASSSPGATASVPTGSAVPTPQPTLGSDGQPRLPVRAAFYYPWFPEAWNQQGMNPFTRYHPTLGYYDGDSLATIRAHVAAMQYAGVQVGIASWWGRSTRTDGRIPALLDVGAASGFRWTVYQEGEGQGDPSVSSIHADLLYLRDRYASDAGFFRINGRFVVFVYADGADGCGMVDRWTAANADVGAYLVLKVFSGYRTCARQPDGWHQYSPAVAEDAQAGHSYAISPGFWKANESSARLGRDLTRWARSVRNMVASGAPFQLVTTFNEWGEGTSVEGATQWPTASGYGAYLDALHNNGQGTGTATPQPTPTRAPTPAPTPVPTAVPTATPTPPPAGSVVLVGAGDIASCGSSGDEATAALLDNIGGTVFTTGDNVYESGTGSEFNNCYAPSWGRHRSRTMPAAGNHDWNTGNAQGYRDYFGFNGRTTYYSYDRGAWHIVVLDSNCSQVGGCSAGSAQYTWLQNDLQASSAGCTVAVWHHPRFSSGEHGNSTSVQPFWQLLYDNDAELVLNGHDHDYERFAPQTPGGAGDAARGLREFVVGTGGKNHYAFGSPEPNSEVRNSDTFGVLKLTLHAGSYDWKFVHEAGKTFTDAGSGTCH